MPLAKAEGGLDIDHPVLLAGDPAAVVGYGDDVIELLATINGDGYLAPLSSQ